MFAAKSTTDGLFCRRAARAGENLLIRGIRNSISDDDDDDDDDDASTATLNKLANRKV